MGGVLVGNAVVGWKGDRLETPENCKSSVKRHDQSKQIQAKAERWDPPGAMRKDDKHVHKETRPPMAAPKF